MIIFSNAMHVLGLLGALRRTPLGMAPYVPRMERPPAAGGDRRGDLVY
jgi:hypothetical protein